MSIPLIIFLLIAAVVAGYGLQAWQRRRRERFIDAYAFPDGIRSRVQKRYPHLTEAELDLVFTALRDYFHLCRKAGDRLLAMPSQVVDVAWHEFILFTRNYQHFCRYAFGRFLHHTPTEAMPSPTLASEGIRRTWRLACVRAGMRPDAASRLPLLFSIDTQLCIADGFRYVLDCTQAQAATAASLTYCASHIGCGGGCGSGCAGSNCGGGGDGGGDGGGCGGGGGD